MDANAFLWAPDSPVNRDAAGNLRFLGGALLAREAGEIVAATLRAHPLEVARAMLRNSVTQLMTAGIGDTLGNEHLEAALRPRIAEAFPARELAAFDASDQARGALRDTLGSFGAQHGPALILALAALGVALRWRGGGLRAWIVVAVLAGVVANAVATGGLSGVFPRYQARVAWLLPVLAMILLLPVRRRPA
jgi:hypothetical protein